MSKNIEMPSDKAFVNICKLSIQHEKPIHFYFYNDSLKNQVIIRTKDNEKIIWKNEEEHSSPILKTFQCDNVFIIITENSIHIISSNTKIEK